MKYFLAVENDNKPFILWASVANSLAEYEELGFDTNPLVIPESEVPIPIYGVCPMKIVNGNLVERTAPEMAAFNAQFLVSKALQNNSQKISIINNETFVHDGHSFPMDEVSRLYYNAIDRVRGNHKIMTTSNTLYELFDTTTLINDFVAAYHNKLLNVSKHTI